MGEGCPEQMTAFFMIIVYCLNDNNRQKATPDMETEFNLYVQLSLGCSGLFSRYHLPTLLYIESQIPPLTEVGHVGRLLSSLYNKAYILLFYFVFSFVCLVDVLSNDVNQQ